MKPIVWQTQADVCLIHFLFIMDLIKKHALPQLLLNIVLEYASRRVQQNLMWPKLNGTHELLVRTCHVNLVGEKPRAIKTQRKLLAKH